MIIENRICIVSNENRPTFPSLSGSCVMLIFPWYAWTLIFRSFSLLPKTADHEGNRRWYEQIVSLLTRVYIFLATRQRNSTCFQMKTWNEKWSSMPASLAWMPFARERKSFFGLWWEREKSLLSFSEKNMGSDAGMITKMSEKLEPC